MVFNWIVHSGRMYHFSCFFFINRNEIVVSIYIYIYILIFKQKKKENEEERKKYPIKKQTKPYIKDN